MSETENRAAAPRSFGPEAVRLDGRIALVTGGGGGIGAGTAATLAAAGARVIVVDVDPDRMGASVDAIVAAGGSAVGEQADVQDTEQVTALRDRVLGRFGRLDVLVNNVGHYLGARPFVRQTPDHWEALYRINYLHVLSTSHAFLPAMIEQRAGSIVNVSSVEGIRGYPPDPVYGAVKAAVIQFTRCLAAQVGNDGVRVNCVAPDITQSIQVDYRTLAAGHEDKWPLWAPVGRMGEPADQADVILFLASDLSRFVTGHTIATDGGTLAQGGWFRSAHRPGRAWTNRPIDP